MSLLVLAVACGSALPPAETPSARASSAALTIANGDNLNGDNLNGDNLNGDNLNGDNLNGDNLNGLNLGSHIVSVSLGSATLAGSQLRVNGPVTGSVFSATSDTGAFVTLTVTSVVPPPESNPDTWEYAVSFWDGSAWKPLCGAGVTAYALDGTWNYGRGVPGGGAKMRDGRSFTFACKGAGAIGKCVGPIGYKPWRGPALDQHHQACVRLLRADFCGDGMPHTVDGNRVNLYDNLGIQQDTEAWAPEAEWDAAGARCLNPLHRNSAAPVACEPFLLREDCGDAGAFSRGALLVDELPSGGLTP